MIYAMRFAGHATPAGPDGNVLCASTTAPSSAVTSRIGAEGLDSTIEATPGGDATFASEMTFSSAIEFLELGPIAFGGGHSLRFSTIGQGYPGPNTDPTLKHGTLMWRVDGGEGQFAGGAGCTPPTSSSTRIWRSLTTMSASFSFGHRLHDCDGCRDRPYWHDRPAR